MNDGAGVDAAGHGGGCTTFFGARALGAAPCGSISTMRFREAVATEFERRRRRNRRYSLRQFARGLGVHHSTVSRLLRGARPVPSRTLITMAGRLGMSSAQVAGFLAREEVAAVVDAIGRSAFRPDSRWLATVAGISVDSVNIALQELLRTGSLRMTSRERWELPGPELSAIEGTRCSSAAE